MVMPSVGGSQARVTFAALDWRAQPTTRRTRRMRLHLQVECGEKTRLRRRIVAGGLPLGGLLSMAPALYGENSRSYPHHLRNSGYSAGLRLHRQYDHSGSPVAVEAKLTSGP